jgi:hypothetical protein
MDVLGRQDQILRGGLSSDSMFMSWPDLTEVGGGLGLLIQQVGLSYAQNIRRVFEIGPGVIPSAGGGIGNAEGSAAFCDEPGLGAIQQALCATRAQPTYYIISRPEGQLQMGRFVGPNVLTACFYRKYGNACGPNVITLSGKAGCSPNDTVPKMTWILSGVTLSSISMNVTGQEMVIQENLSLIYSNLKLLINDQEPVCEAELVAGWSS